MNSRLNDWWFVIIVNIIEVEKIGGNVKYLLLHLNYNLEWQEVVEEYNESDQENIGK